MLGRLLAIALVGLSLAGASACGEAAAPASPSPAAASDDKKEACDAVLKARKTARDALVPVATARAQDKPSASEIAKATDDLKATFTAMHLDVAAAGERAGAPQLKEQITAYQMSVEQAIVVVEGADGDKTKLASAISLPELLSSEKALLGTCS